MGRKATTIPMTHVLELAPFNWRDLQQGLELCKIIQSNAFDVIVTISTVGRDDTYTILLLSGKPVSLQDMSLPIKQIPSTQDLDDLHRLALSETLQGLTKTIARTGLSILIDYPNIPAFDASYVDEQCAEGFDPNTPIVPNIDETVQLMSNIQKMGGDPNEAAVIIGFPSHPFNPLP
ncbi:MAG: hypothetical protein COB59_04105 [Rhodospirillaceae bacterium]|nr:MAG: hypothetical protein COB59_04105 [Rhodospirillaceae bacterium]